MEFISVSSELMNVGRAPEQSPKLISLLCSGTVYVLRRNRGQSLKYSFPHFQLIVRIVEEHVGRSVEQV